MDTIGRVKPGGLTGKEQISVQDIDGITYTGTLQKIADLIPLKSGSTQNDAGAAANEKWIDTGDQTIKVGV